MILVAFVVGLLVGGLLVAVSLLALLSYSIGLRDIRRLLRIARAWEHGD